MSYRGRLSIDTMVELYEKGYEPDEIGHMYGYKNGDYIRAKLRDAGVWTAARLDTGKVGALHKAHWSIRDIAIEMGTTERQIREVINGIKTE